MSKTKIHARAKAPGVAVPPKGTKIERVKEGDHHPLIAFQPTMKATTTKEAYSLDEIRKLEEWWEEISAALKGPFTVSRTGPFVETSQGTVIVWTFSGDLDDQDMDEPRFGDDCE